MKNADPRQQTSPQEIAEFLVSKAVDHMIVFGPLVWRPSDGGSSKYWYFIVGSADESGEFHCDQIIGGADDRLALLAALVSRPPLLVHDFADELEMARFCEAAWPCAKITRIRKQLEQERKK